MAGIGGVLQLEKNATMDALLGQQAETDLEDDEELDLEGLGEIEEPADFQARRAKMWQLADESGEKADNAQAELDKLDVPEFEGVPPPPPPEKTNPIEVFGSTASMIAIFGSLLTRRPLQNALNGAADVIDAYKANDAAKAKASFDNWKRNVDFAESNYEHELTTYKAAIDKIQAGSKIGFSELQAHASAFKNDTMLMAARERNAAAVMNAYTSSKRLQAQLGKSKLELEKLNERQELYTAAVAEEEKKLGRPLTPHERLAKLNEFMTVPRAGQTAEGLTPNQALSQSRRAWLDKYGEKDYFGNVQPKSGAPSYEGFIDSGEWERLKGKVEKPGQQPDTPPKSAVTPTKPQARGADSLLPAERSGLAEFFKAKPNGTAELGDGTRWKFINGQIVPVALGPSGGGNLTLAQAEAMGGKIKPKGGQTPQSLREEEERAARASFEFKQERDAEKPLGKGEMEAFDASLAPPEYGADLRTQMPEFTLSAKGEKILRNPLAPEIPSRGAVRSIAELRKAPVSSFSKEELRAYGKAGPQFIVGMPLTDEARKRYEFIRDTEGQRLATNADQKINDTLLVGTVEETLRDAIKRRMDMDVDLDNIADTRPDKDDPSVDFSITRAEAQEARDQLDNEIAELMNVKRKLQMLGAAAAKRAGG